MKVKHFAGYGCVNVTKTYQDKKRGVIELLVEGDHEWGLEVIDSYSLEQWLGKRFLKQPHEILGYQTEYLNWDETKLKYTIFYMDLDK